jgi:hypothetical protein
MKVLSPRTHTAQFALVLLVLIGSLVPVRATTIDYIVTDLADATPGEDLWRYDYAVSGRTFLQSEFFDIYFNASLYGTLTSEPAPSADWDVLILQQPDPTKLQPFDKGIFDAFALTGNPSLSGLFSVAFIYLGTGSPGAQPFDIFDANSNPLETGLTSVPAGVIPEPSTVTLSLIALVGFVMGLHRRRKIRRCVQ